MILDKNKEKLYLKKLNFKSFTSLQKQVFFSFDDPLNLVINGKTGTGKTYAYAIPLLEQITSTTNQGAIIFVPTLELQTQTRKMINNILPSGSDLIISSINYNKEEIVLRTKQAKPWILITTIFEFEKYLERGCNFSSVKSVIFDEADMLCEGDLLEKTIKVSKYFDSVKKILVSATITSNLKPFIKNYFGTFKQIGTVEAFARQKHILINAGLKSIDEIVQKLLTIVNPYLMIIFVSKIEKIRNVSALLNNLGFKHLTISSSDSMSLRKQKLQMIKDNKYQYVIASDLLSRGLNLNCSHVLNYDIPYDLDYFIHRAGRTARMDQNGIVYTILDKKNEKSINRLRAKGVPFIRHELKNDALVSTDRTRKLSPLVKEVIKSVKKPTKIKPNYKKRYHAELNKKIKQAKVKEMLKQKRKNKFREDNK